MSGTQNFPAELARVKIERVAEQQRTLVDELSATYRWLMASLLAVNGGGLVSLASADFSSTVLKFAGGSFAIGVIAAFGLAWSGHRINARGYKVLSEIELFWRAALINGELDLKRGEELEGELSQIKTYHWKMFSVASVLCWIVGIFQIGVGL